MMQSLHKKATLDFLHKSKLYASVLRAAQWWNAFQTSDVADKDLGMGFARE